MHIQEVAYLIRCVSRIPPEGPDESAETQPRFQPKTYSDLSWGL